MTTLLLIWDYDTPTGFAVSHLSRDADPYADYTTTDRILERLALHHIPTTFACVGLAAVDGPLPVHNPAQIRAIHAAGHEVASHSHRHELLPSLPADALRETLRTSKDALEQCLGAPIHGLVPPWNRPFHHPHRGVVSNKDRRAGGGWWRLSVVRLCAALHETGYRWLRIRYRPLWGQLLDRLHGRPRPPIQPTTIATHHAITTFRVSYCGYDDALISHIIAAPRDATYVIYAHPHAIAHDNAQHWRHFTRFIDWAVARGDTITFTTPSAWLAAHA